MHLTFNECNPATDTAEYHKLLNDNLRVIRGRFVQFFVTHRDRYRFRRFLKNKAIVTIRVDGALAGFIVCTLRDNRTLHIQHFHLKPQFRGQGVGTRTLEFAEAKAKKLGCTALQLEVYASNPALRLYTRFGFKKVRFYYWVCWWIYVVRKNI